MADKDRQNRNPQTEDEERPEDQDAGSSPMSRDTAATLAKGAAAGAAAGAAVGAAAAAARQAMSHDDAAEDEDDSDQAEE